MKEIALTRDLLNSNKILFHYGKMLEEMPRAVWISIPLL